MSSSDAMAKNPRSASFRPTRSSRRDCWPKPARGRCSAMRMPRPVLDEQREPSETTCTSPIPDLAQKDFDALVKLVEEDQLKVEGVALVTSDADGTVTVKETGDHLGRKGLEIGGGVGLAVGLLAPPLLAATVVGGAVGGVVGKFTRHRVESGLEEKMGRAASDFDRHSSFLEVVGVFRRPPVLQRHAGGGERPRRPRLVPPGRRRHDSARLGGVLREGLSDGAQRRHRRRRTPRRSVLAMLNGGSRPPDCLSPASIASRRALIRSSFADSTSVALPSRRRRVVSMNVEVIEALTTVKKPIPTSITTEATSRPVVLVGTRSPSRPSSPSGCPTTGHRRRWGSSWGR